MNILESSVLSEKIFEELLPEKVRQKSKRFFTPESIAIEAAKWLTDGDGRKVLDIGAGVGKFCLFGAKHTGAEFIGIEARPKLVKIANEMFERFGVNNAHVEHGDIIDFKFNDFTAFFYYNPFGENLVRHLRLDDELILSEKNYYMYTEHVFNELNKVSKGSRLVTYHGGGVPVPESYECVGILENQSLKFWRKKY